MLAYLRLNMWPDLNVGEIYLLNSQCFIKFLHDIDFHNGTFDIKDIEKNIDKHKENYLTWVYTSAEYKEKRQKDEEAGGGGAAA